ncbi:transposase [Kitasatospora sp. NPDC056731]|uniref:transposase n=1 Tax=Kitasatospora sp. NPDC056731 TaxID=3155422 RepID=UPI003433EBEC
MSDRKPYKSDLSDERWVLIEPVITSWKARHPSVSGHQGSYDIRDIVNALLYRSRTGCQWDFLPHDLPPAGAVKYYFYKWRDDGTDQTIHDLLRWQVREKRGRFADPSPVVLDTQSLHAAAGVPAGTTGRDPNKKVPGRKRGLAVDVLGLVIAVVVLAASVHDNAFGTAGRARHRRRGDPDHPQDAAGATRSTPPAPPAAKLPDHPAYQEIMAVFAVADAPLRARAVCEAMDVEIAPSSINNARLKLKRLTERGILVETEQGLFTLPRP